MLSEDELLGIDEKSESDAKRVKLSPQDNLEINDNSEGKYPYPTLPNENMFKITDIIDEKNCSEISNDNPLEINYTAEETEFFFGQRPFTKNQMRKWLKKEKWEARKNEKRAKEKAKAKLKRFEAKVNNIDIGPSRKALKHSKVANSSCTSGMIIDLSFDNLMIEKDRAKVIKQILRCYSLNRRSPSPMNFTVCSFGPRTKKEMARHNGYEYWDVKFEENGYLDVFAKEQLVYLSSESENVIEAVEPNKMYIIGGLVDHNAHKGLCHKIAVEQGIQHARLPIDKYLNMKSRKVLTIDHVFEILLRVSEGKTWPEALMQVVPMRKGATSVTGKKSSQTSEADDPQLDEDSPDSEDDDAKEASGVIDEGSSQNTLVAAADSSEHVESCPSLKSDTSTTKCDNDEVQS